MEINFVNLYTKKWLPVELRFSKPQASLLHADVPCNYIRLPLSRQHIGVFLKNVPLLHAIFLKSIL